MEIQLTTLVLSQYYECMDFRSTRRSIQLIFKEKVEVLENWDEEWRGGERGGSTSLIQLPAVVRLTYRTPWIPRKYTFSRFGVFNRDLYTCQYCGHARGKRELTIDHIVPKSKGGKNDWMNCVAACKDCNNLKKDLLPKEAGMRLLREPFIPNLSVKDDLSSQPVLHPQWNNYLG